MVLERKDLIISFSRKNPWFVKRQVEQIKLLDLICRPKYDGNKCPGKEKEVMACKIKVNASFK